MCHPPLLSQFPFSLSVPAMGVTAPTANHLLAKRSSTFGGDFNTQQAGRFAKFAAIRRASSYGQQALGRRSATSDCILEAEIAERLTVSVMRTMKQASFAPSTVQAVGNGEQP